MSAITLTPKATMFLRTLGRGSKKPHLACLRLHGICRRPPTSQILTHLGPCLVKRRAFQQRPAGSSASVEGMFESYRDLSEILKIPQVSGLFYLGFHLGALTELLSSWMNQELWLMFASRCAE